MSNKREVRQAAARLRNLGKVVPLHRSDEERLREAQQAARNQDIYEAAPACPACSAAQRAGQDASALCEAHLQAALGFPPR